MIILSGPPGSGKGTQAALLEEREGFARVGIGSRLRRLAQTDATIAAVLEAGELVGTDQMTRLFEEILPDNHERVVLDGAPREAEQAAWLKAWLEHHPISSPNYVIELAIDDDTSKARTTQRDRSDDTTETIATRLEQYRTVTAPAIRSLEPAVEIHSIDGSQDVEAVFTRIQDIIHGKKA